MVEKHPIHVAIGNILKDTEIKGLEPIIGTDCGGLNKIKLYRTDKPLRGTAYCEPDIIILKEDKVCVIIEIEETGRTPIKIFGKFLTPNLTQFYIPPRNKGKPYKLDDTIIFIQIIVSYEEKTTTHFEEMKREQYEIIKQKIEELIKTAPLLIKHYYMIVGKPEEFQKKESPKSAELITLLQNI